MSRYRTRSNASTEYTKVGVNHRKWKLDDGTVWTTTELKELIGCSSSSAYHRLIKSTDPAYVLRPIEQVKRVRGQKLYLLDDGSEWTARMVTKHTGCLPSTAATRLCCYTDPAKVLAPPQGKVYKDRMVGNAMKRRMYADPLGHWALINKFV